MAGRCSPVSARLTQRPPGADGHSRVNARGAGTAGMPPPLGGQSVFPHEAPRQPRTRQPRGSRGARTACRRPRHCQAARVHGGRGRGAERPQPDQPRRPRAPAHTLPPHLGAEPVSLPQPALSSRPMTVGAGWARGGDPGGTQGPRLRRPRPEGVPAPRPRPSCQPGPEGGRGRGWPPPACGFPRSSLLGWGDLWPRKAESLQGGGAPWPGLSEPNP